MLRSVVRSILLALPALLLDCVSAHGQVPDKFTNLKVLPKNISKSELTQIMRNFSFALGARCEHCHMEKKAPEKGLDFAADDKDPKKTARLMLQMVEAINRDYVGKVDRADKAAPIRVQCVTCHHGITEPQPLNEVLAARLEKDGIEKTTALYNELRGKYYGTGAYDFGETRLNLLVESLLAKEKKPEAVAIAELNFSANHPDTVWSYHLLAMAHRANGQTDKAIADYRKVLELHPDDDWAKQQVEALTKGKAE
jgi:tetratricopeptide (TPR) repeat protein